MDERLTQKTCVPCQGEISALVISEAEELLVQTPGWQLKEKGHHLHKRYEFNDFLGSLSFVNKLGKLAEAEGHHPDIELGWGRVKIIIWTHKIDGLSESDFILAAKISAIGKTAA